MSMAVCCYFLMRRGEGKGPDERGGKAERLEEEADGGRAGGSGFQAGGEVFGGEAAESEDRSGRGEVGGLGEEGEAGAGPDELAPDALFKDRAEEDEVGGERASAADVFEGMAGEADRRGR